MSPSNLILWSLSLIFSPIVLPAKEFLFAFAVATSHSSDNLRLLPAWSLLHIRLVRNSLSLSLYFLQLIHWSFLSKSVNLFILSSKMLKFSVFITYDKIRTWLFEVAFIIIFNNYWFFLTHLIFFDDIIIAVIVFIYCWIVESSCLLWLLLVFDFLNLSLILMAMIIGYWSIDSRSSELIFFYYVKKGRDYGELHSDPFLLTVNLLFFF